MQAKHDELFEESSQGAVSAVTAFMIVISFALFFGGIVLSGYAFGLDVPAIEIFSLGLAASFLGLIIPTTLLPATGK